MDDHLTLDLLRAIHEDKRSPRELATKALGHLLALCPRCHRAFEEWHRETFGSVPEISPSIEEGLGCSGTEEARVEGPVAEERLAELLATPILQRAERVRDQPHRFQGPHLARLLLEEIRRCLPARPREAHALAKLTRAVVQHEEASDEVTALYARALAHEGNALRALGDLAAAADLLETARYLIVSRGCEDPVAVADVDYLEGTLRRLQRRLEEARVLTSRAAEAYCEAGMPLELACALISLGIVWRALRRPDRAIEVTKRALGLLDPVAEPRLVLCAQHNLAVFHRDSGDLKQARQVLQIAEPLYVWFPDSLSRLLKRTIEGDLAYSDGDYETAEAAYREVREGHVRENRPLDAALVGKQLAALLASKRRFPELEELTREIVAVFEELQVYPEADAARRFLEEATGAGSPPVH